MIVLDRDRFAPVFADLGGQRLGLVDGVGNPGDRLIDLATRQLLTHFGLAWRTINPLADPADLIREQSDLLLLFGGGSMGSRHAGCVAIREAALATRVPCRLLPQSFYGPEPGPWERALVRERASLRHCPGGVLAPDLALGFDFPAIRPTTRRIVSLREHGGGLFRPQNDPLRSCYSAADYFAWLAPYGHVVTDRLHLAIAALGLGRRATLLPLNYHKNRSMWETWLRDLGCAWADSPEEALP